MDIIEEMELMFRDTIGVVQTAIGLIITAEVKGVFGKETMTTMGHLIGKIKMMTMMVSPITTIDGNMADKLNFGRGYKKVEIDEGLPKFLIENHLKRYLQINPGIVNYSKISA